MQIRIYKDNRFHELNYTSYKELIEIFNQYRDCYWDNNFIRPWLYDNLEINFNFWKTDIFSFINNSPLLECAVKEVLDIIESLEEN